MASASEQMEVGEGQDLTTTETQIHDLPDEVLVEIVRRVDNAPELIHRAQCTFSPKSPAMQVLQCRLVCKRWLSAVAVAVQSLSLNLDRMDEGPVHLGQHFRNLTMLTLRRQSGWSLQMPSNPNLYKLDDLVPQLETLALQFAISPHTIWHMAFLKGCRNLRTLTARLTAAQMIPQHDNDDSTWIETWLDDVSMLPQLTRLNLALRLPSSVYASVCERLGAMTNLQEVHLSSCRHPQAAGRLPGILRSLFCDYGYREYTYDFLLYMSDTGLQYLQGLTALETLELKNLPRSVEKLSEHLGSLSRLTRLKVSRADRLRSLPDSLGRLSNLQELSATRCRALQSLPESLWDLQRLRILRIEECSELPDSLSHLTSLEALHAKSSLPYVKTLPLLSVIDQLSRIKSLRLLFKKAMPELPECLGMLTNLEELEIRGCRADHLPESLAQLTRLRACTLGLDHMQALPEMFGNYCSLERLVVKCNKISSLPASLCQLGTLSKLSIMSCHKLETLPADIGELTALRLLRVFHSRKLTSLPDSLGRLSNLEVLSILRCESLTSLPRSTRDLSALKKLQVHSQSSSLKELPEGLEHLPRLECLECSFSLLRSGLRAVWSECRIDSVQIARESDLDNDSDAGL